MKERLTMLLLAAALLPTVASAQERRPFVVEGKAWNYAYEKYKWDDENREWITDYIIYYGHHIEGDTLIGDETWKRLCQYSERDGVETHTLAGALREDGDKVFYYDKKNDQTGELYNFGLEIGELPPNELISEWMGRPSLGPLLKKHTVTLSTGLEATVYVFEDVGENRIGTIWIEGIGGPDGYMPAKKPEVTGAKGIASHYGDSDTYLSCTLNGEVLATGQEIYDLYDSAITEYLLGVDTPATAPDKTEVYYDLQGRRLTSAPDKGVYIHNGKKVAK